MVSKALAFVFFLFFVSAAHADSGTWSSKLQIRNPGHEFLLLGAEARVSPGEHYKKIVILGGSLDFQGSTEEMVLVAGHVRLARGSEVSKSLVVMGGTMDREDGAKLSQEQVQFKAPGALARFGMSMLDFAGDFFHGLVRWLGVACLTLLLWALGLIFRAMFPKYFADSAHDIFPKAIRNFGWSLLGLLSFWPVIIFLVLSVVGIALVPFFVAVYLFSFALAYTIFAAKLGQLLTREQGPKSSARSFLVGLGVLAILLSLLPAGILFFLFLFILLSWGSALRNLKQRIFS